MYAVGWETSEHGGGEATGCGVSAWRVPVGSLCGGH